MNTKAIFSKESDHWATPEALRLKLYEEFSLNADPCPLYSTNGLDLELWRDQRVFCNPPYSKIPEFLEARKVAQMSVFLLPSRTGTRWFHEQVLPFASEIRFLRGRLKFSGTKNSAPFDSVVVVYL